MRHLNQFFSPRPRLKRLKNTVGGSTSTFPPRNCRIIIIKTRDNFLLEYFETNISERTNNKIVLLFQTA